MIICPVGAELLHADRQTDRHNDDNSRLMSVCPCIISAIVNDDQQDANILAYLFIPNQLYMFRAMSSPIIRST